MDLQKVVTTAAGTEVVAAMPEASAGTVATTTAVGTVVGMVATTTAAGTVVAAMPVVATAAGVSVAAVQLEPAQVRLRPKSMALVQVLLLAAAAMQRAAAWDLASPLVRHDRRIDLAHSVLLLAETMSAH